MVSLDRSLRPHNSLSNDRSLSRVLPGLSSHSPPGLIVGASASNGILPNSNSSLSVSVIVASSADSVDASSLLSSVPLQRVVGFGSSSCVSSPVRSPSSPYGGDPGDVSGDRSGDSSDDFLEGRDLTLDRLDFLLDRFLFFRINLRKSPLDRPKSFLQVPLLSFVGLELLLFLIELPLRLSFLFLSLSLLDLEL